MAEHSIWAGAAPPWEPTAHADGDPSIRTAVAFYATTTPWYVAGARLRAPAGSGVGLVTLSLHITANGVMPDLSATPVASAQVAVGSAGGWYDARWPGLPVPLAAPNAAWIVMETAAGDGYLFVADSSIGPSFVQAAGGVDLYMAEAGHPRAAYRVPPDPTSFSHAWYGLDVIVTDDPDGAPPPSGGSAATVTVAASGTGRARRLGGSAPGAVVDAMGSGRARRRGASAAVVDVAAPGSGRKRVRGGSAGGITVHAVGTGYNPDGVEPLPTRGILVPRVTVRELVPRTPLRTLEARC